MPAGAKIIVRKGQRFAEWNGQGKDANGAAHRREGRHRPYRDYRPAPTPPSIGTARGSSAKVATGCRDESAARSVLIELEKRAEKVKGGILTVDEAGAIDHQESHWPNKSTPT